MALQGTKFHGSIFIKEAIKNGASAILYEIKKNNINNHGNIKYIKKNIPIIYFVELSKHLNNISKIYYQVSKTLKLIGVTGTNGKSTVTHIIAQWHYLLNKKIGIMGTLGHGSYNNLKSSSNTTESQINIQKFLKKMLKKNIKIVALEVSSHGIIQNRISNLHFSIAILTNVTSDHLDYHKTIENYIQSKWIFFSQTNIKTFIINNDDYIANTFIQKLSKKNVIVVSIKKNFQHDLFKKWIHAYKIIKNIYFTYIFFKSSWGNGKLKSKLIGNFNITNLLLALAALLELKYPLSVLINKCKKIKAIPGRMQLFKTKKKPFVVIDYAHNEHAFKNVLTAIRSKYRNKIWCIFGCGGDRDKSKRSLMRKISEKIADKTILTNDNPRNEDPMEIITEIIKGRKLKKNMYIILDRKKAITFAIINAKFHDCVLILGKGHETYQIIKEKKYYFSDHDIVKTLLKQ
ncbi:MAG: UDP-N-acetylmuramoyl-L-alanyl-D-glutamate--2,6-diaminopimelate ligase [Buchnera aphidicola (Nurudea yanoniella)]